MPLSTFFVAAPAMPRGSAGDKQSAPAIPGTKTIAPESIVPTDPNWEAGYQTRLKTLMYGKSFHVGNGNNDPDDGKRDWPALLAEMWKARGDDARVRGYIEKQGAALVASRNAGTFYKPFSCPGYVRYYMAYKAILPQSQKDALKAMLAREGWDEMARGDQHMDPIYPKTEFNSENFHWMDRIAGFLLAADSGDKHQLARFAPFVPNLTRALFSVGRVEWNSNNYFGYVFINLLNLYDYAPDTATKNQARAMLDWMVFEAALHYVDGFQVGPDVRAKAGAYHAFAGSVWPFAYLYFADSGPHHPTYSDADAAANAPLQMMGFIPYTTYRPPQAAIDIAQRRFPTPVEMHNAKPFYRLAWNDYADWAGDTDNSRRFEFETSYIDRDYTLGSVATFRPDGAVGTFSEENVWSLAMRGTDHGAIQVFGNAGNFVTDAGRCPREEVSQARNVLARIVRKTDNIWVALPLASHVERVESRVFAEIGSGVYAAITPCNETTMQTSPYPGDTAYAKYTWTFDPGQAGLMGALVMEVGTRAENGSFAEFQDSVLRRSTATVAGDRLSYKSADGHSLDVEYVPPTTYALSDGSGKVIDPAGVPPKVWAGGKYLDFSHWNPYEVVDGPAILREEWGSASLQVSTGASPAFEIVVDRRTGQVIYKLP